MDDIEKRLTEIEAQLEAMPAYANPRRYIMRQSGGRSADGIKSVDTCATCFGLGHVAARTDSEYVTVHIINGQERNKCPACMGSGKTVMRYTADELAALKE